MDELELKKKRINLYHVGDVPIHIVSNDDSWYNGYIIEVYDDYFTILDRYKGKLPVFYADIRVLEYFRGDFDTLKKPEEGKDG